MVDLMVNYKGKIVISDQINKLYNDSYELKTLDYLQDFINYQEGKFITAQQ